MSKMYEGLARTKVSDARRSTKHSMMLARDRSSRPLTPRLSDRAQAWIAARAIKFGERISARLAERQEREARAASQEWRLAEK